MSKKLISLLMACLMVMSFAIVVNADAPVVNLTVGNVDARTVADNYTEIQVPISIDTFPANNIATIQVELEITNIGNFDGEMYGYGMGTVANGDIKVGSGTLQAAPPAPVLNAAGVGSWNGAEWAQISTGTFTIGYASLAANTRYSNYMKENGKNVLVNLSLYKAVAAEGVSEIKIKAIEFGDTDGKAVPCTTNLVGGSVTFSDVVIPDPDPVATTVKTFPKRFYEVGSKTLTTVGLILEGDDYVETATAGIYANGEAFAAAPIAGAEGKSYILVGLQGVTETSKINLGTATQAYVNLGAEDILGAEVTDYTSDATKVTDGDIDGFSEVE